VNEYNLADLFFTAVLLISVMRSQKKLKTFLFSIAALMIVSFIVWLSILFLPVNSDVALGHLAADTGKMAGMMTAYFYSRKTREGSPRSVYLLAIPCTALLLVWLALGNF
jgi:hypothetical protein